MRRLALGEMTQLLKGLARMHTRVVTTIDPKAGPKPRKLVTALGEPGVVAAFNQSKHQAHLISFDAASGDSDIVVRVTEAWSSGTYSAQRELKFTHLVHLLLNITDEEIATIANRDTDAGGLKTTT